MSPDSINLQVDVCTNIFCIFTHENLILPFFYYNLTSHYMAIFQFYVEKCFEVLCLNEYCTVFPLKKI